VRLTVTDGLVFDLTKQEAGILSRALAAVRDGRSKVDEVYMSPIASDGDFSGKVMSDGILVASKNQPVHLEWSAVGEIAGALAAFAPEPE
jgi:hypothetical protein